MADLCVETLAEDALLLRFGDGIGIATNARVHAAARALREANLPGVVDIAPAYATLLVRFDPEMVPGTIFPIDLLRNVVERNSAENEIVPDTISPCVEIPASYGGECGPDVDAVAEHTGLSHEEVISRHTSAEYTVAMLGFAPGFPYLLGLDASLHVPRRATPRTRVPAGSIAIGGAQTGIYPTELPGGWQLIGRTPLKLFDSQRQPPCLLAPGDRVRFRAIDANEFARLTERDA